ncbi:FimB/Mfa2 family fimbrial subunit [uncultured Bacteroides sp.]|uniref:FimB/Mfa2 family fimbrial subunit n=1 Tax=uncultured Bacteroides sp. TaxID=162156 RepID=UPI0025CBBD80|nr:FimB/Mfa2 family fimbrial subunit [uncultured Bacteroides sp.]
MKRILTTIQEKANKILLLTILAGTIASCDSILDYNDGDCSIEYCVKFKYDYNMEEVDVFAKQVRTVTLYAFDDNNNLVYQKTDQGEPLGEDNYSMTVDQDLSKYHLIVWAGLNDESFAVPLLYPKQSEIEELKVKTLRKAATRSNSEDEKGQYIVEQELHSLWHGEVKNAATTRSSRQQITTVSLVKNTNNIRIVVAQVAKPNGTVTRALTEETFKCEIYDDNGYMNYDNSLLDDNLLTYKPFVVEPEVVTSRAFSAGNEPAKEYNAIVSEISVARLMENKTPELTIKNSETQEVLFHVPNLVSYLEKLQLEKYKDRNYTLQEYLDREDSYSMIIFVDENLALIKTVIDVNDWIIQINDIEL